MSASDLLCVCAEDDEDGEETTDKEKEECDTLEDIDDDEIEQVMYHHELSSTMLCASLIRCCFLRKR